MGDPNQLKQVFLNLINNSVHALAENGPGRPKQIGINTFSTDSAVSVEITDTGSGIPADVLPKIFEPFFTTKREKGTGLGLSITFKIIQSHQGKLDVRSEPGVGSTFTVSLPVHIAEGLKLRPVTL
jgi:signal transduction histidine kinase